MKAILTALFISVMILVGVGAVSAENPKDKVKIEIVKIGKGLQHHGLNPGLYVCAGAHLHIKGTVQNLTKKTLTSIKLEGKAFDAKGQLVGTAYPRKLKPLRLVPLEPGQKAEFDLEFREITGEKIRKTKMQEVVVIEARH